MKITKSILLIFCIVPSLLISQDNSKNSEALKPGMKIPAFILPQYGTNNQYQKSRLLIKEKKISGFSFFTTTCIPCKKEIPELIDLNKEFPEIGIYLISLDKERDNIIKPYLTEHKFNLPILMDPYHIASKNFKVQTVPSFFLVDSNGVILYCIYKYDKNMIKNVKEIILKQLQSINDNATE